jgi:hypothetical protein
MPKQLIANLCQITPVPLDIWRIIFTYTYDLRCVLYEEKREPFRENEVTYDFGRFLIQTSRIDILRDVISLVPPHESPHLFEDCLLFHQVECARLIYSVFHPPIFTEECLSYAVEESCSSMIRFLLDTDYYTRTPLSVFEMALQRGNSEILLTLLDHSKTDHCLSEEDDNQTLIGAIELRKHNLVSILVEHQKIDAHLHDNEPFFTAMYLEDKIALSILWKDPYVKRTLCLPSEASFYPYREIIMSCCI